MLELADYTGLTRSLLIYYGRPFRIRRLAGFYRQFVGSGDLCFDIGAHVGTHVKALRRLGARVVSLEPQPLFSRYLEWTFRSDPEVHLHDLAAGPAEGTHPMFVSRRTPTVSTLAPDWIGEVGSSPGFRAVKWDQAVDVDIITLDTLITQYGKPQFCKIDVEGSEPAVLQGLSHTIPCISFEYTAGMFGRLEACLARLTSLGRYLFNWTEAEQMRLARPTWVDRETLIGVLNDGSNPTPFMDIIARDHNG